MEELFSRTLDFMESMFSHFVQLVPQPVKQTYEDSFVFRYEEQTIYQAIVLKLARMVTCLYSAKTLFEHGLFQDQASLQRMLDEFQEDILFLFYGIGNDDVTTLHATYLREFYKEEFDEEVSAIDSKQKRGMVPRQKIRAYLANIEGEHLDPSRSVEVSRTLSKMYSGYIHGSSPHILDMYGGDPPHFHLHGMLGTPRQSVHLDDLWSHFYRGILSFGVAAKAFGEQEAYDQIIQFRDSFEEQSGTNYSESAKKPNN